MPERYPRWLLWLGAALSPPLAYVAFQIGLGYALRYGVRIPPDKLDELLSYAGLAVSIGFAALFVYCVWRLLRRSNAASST